MFHFPQKTSFGLDLSDLSFKIVQFKKKKDGLYVRGCMQWVDNTLFSC